MRTYQLLVSEQVAFKVDIEAESEEEAIDRYYNGNGSDEYGHKTIEYYVVEAIPY
jgi:hypothetical protein